MKGTNDCDTPSRLLAPVGHLSTTLQTIQYVKLSEDPGELFCDTFWPLSLLVICCQLGVSLPLWAFRLKD